MGGRYYLTIKVQADTYPTYDVSCSDTTTDLTQVRQMVDGKVSDAIEHISGGYRRGCRLQLDVRMHHYTADATECLCNITASEYKRMAVATLEVVRAGLLKRLSAPL